VADRAHHIHTARVYIAQARVFFARTNGTRNFGFVLLEWAGNQRRRAMATKDAQGDLFA
jgi:hypothetical protein